MGKCARFTHQYCCGMGDFLLLMCEGLCVDVVTSHVRFFEGFCEVMCEVSSQLCLGFFRWCMDTGRCCCVKCHCVSLEMRSVIFCKVLLTRPSVFSP